jgi:hypothetical protein
VTVFGGDVIYASDVNNLPRGLIARYSRTSSISGVTTTETGYIRMDSISVRDGYRYQVVVPRVNVSVDAVDRIGRVRLRAALGSTATTSSDVIGETRVSQPTSTSQTNMDQMIAFYDASSDGYLSILLSVIRASGAGSVGLYASSGEPCWMYVMEIGITPSSSGTSI